MAARRLFLAVLAPLRPLLKSSAKRLIDVGFCADKAHSACLAPRSGIGQVMVNAALRLRPGRGPRGYGVRNVRHLLSAACLAAITISSISSASAGDRIPVNASYRASAPVSRAADQVPANCIREACGRLFCWNTNSMTSR